MGRTQDHASAEPPGMETEDEMEDALASGQLKMSKVPLGSCWDVQRLLKCRLFMSFSYKDSMSRMWTFVGLHFDLLFQDSVHKCLATIIISCR